MAQTLEHNNAVETVTAVALPTFDGDVSNIQKLDDEPNDVGGMTAAQLKAEFDKGNEDIVKYINETLVPAVLAQDSTEEARQLAEGERVANEIERVSNENARVSAETSRSAAETSRVNAEQLRSTAESNRQTAEQLRASAETARANAETGRTDAEETRASAEETRATAETARAAAEQSRTSVETARVNAETARANAETGRVNAEGLRVTRESARASAETERAAAESSRASAEADRADAESGRSSAEQARSTAETGRTNAEETRASHESARVDAESGRVSAESFRVTRESARVSAESERATAETERAAAETGRANAESDRASAETTRADNESTRVSNEQTRVSNEQARVSNESARISAEQTRRTNEAARQDAETGYIAQARDAAEDSEAWAVGQRGGQDVPSSDETYHNNAKYWAGEAQHAAQGGVSSFNGRSGTVEPQSGDYTAAMVGADASGAAAAVQTNLATHVGNTSNPHSVTKAQVGLGNVPNVATNDQTPTYTEAGTLAALTSGEKLSVAFGKLKKAVSNLISHLADTTRHITAAERTSWNAKQNALTFDTTPTASSTNPVTSGGVKSYVDASYTIAGRKSGTTLGTKATAEGANTTASGHYSHAEGCDTTASHSGSHAEGYSTTASGFHSHAEGDSTTAQRRSQHVFGEYNVPDTMGGSTSSKGQFIEIVGNGTKTDDFTPPIISYSNARTLDWSGNETLAGKLTLGAAPTANMDAATKQYVDNAVAAAGKSPYVYSFAASDWTAGTDDATITIAAATHGFTGNAVLAQFWHQVNGVYQFNTWACIESWAEINASTHVITLHGPTAGYAGKVILYG